MRANTMRGMIAVGVTAAMVAVVGPAASAEDPVEQAADLIADVAPDQGSVVAGTVTDDAVATAAGGTEVAVPVDPAEPLTLTAVGDQTSAPIEVSLPEEIAVADAQVADDGTIVYQATDGGADAAVQVLDDGTTRIQTITSDADGPRAFTYEFGAGIEPILLDDGTVGLASTFEAGWIVHAIIDAPWAVDANGNEVSTSYSVADGALVQTITPDADAAYPIVADPTISVGLGWYITYSKTEVRNIVNSNMLNASHIGTIICGAMPWPFNGVCAASNSMQANSIIGTFKNAKKAGQCVQLHYVGSPVHPILVGWKGIKC